MAVFFSVLLLLIVGAFVLTGLATWISTKRLTLRNIFTFSFAVGAAYSLGFVFNMWLDAASGNVLVNEVAWPSFTWCVITFSCLAAAILTNGSALTLSIPFFLHAAIVLFFATTMAEIVFIACPLLLASFAIFYLHRKLNVPFLIGRHRKATNFLFNLSALSLSIPFLLITSAALVFMPASVPPSRQIIFIAFFFLVACGLVMSRSMLRPNTIQNTDEENLRWSWLRAIEWEAWPFFISQPVVPILLYSFAWWKIIIGLILIQFAWTVLVRNKFVSVALAGGGAIFVLLKWVVCPITAYRFFEQGQFGLAALAFLWPFAMLIIKQIVWMIMALILIPFQIEIMQIGIVQSLFMNKLGYSQREVDSN